MADVIDFLKFKSNINTDSKIEEIENQKNWPIGENGKKYPPTSKGFSMYLRDHPHKVFWKREKS